MKYIGIVDSCFSNKYLFDNKKYSFTNYSKSHKPYIQAIQFCHPYLDNAVRNDICLNGNNMLITGPNAAGKSTFIKSIKCYYESNIRNIKCRIIYNSYFP